MCLEMNDCSSEVGNMTKMSATHMYEGVSKSSCTNAISF